MVRGVPSKEGKGCHNEGQSACTSGNGGSSYMLCSGGEWTEVVCGAGTTCGQVSHNQASCQPSTTPSPQNSGSSSTASLSSTSISTSSLTSTSPAPSAVKCSSEGASMCDSSGVGKYLQCVKQVWTSMACSTGTVCRIVSNSAVCVDPNTPTASADSDEAVESAIPCDTANATMCDSSNPASFFTCISKKWTKMLCDGTNVCMARNGKTS
ncbi:hypothetical protein GGI26_000356, partial [Coemansia sp. RSA 1358]